jgi:hypothetical protein
MKSSTNYRDLILFAALLFMVKMAWNLPNRRSLEQQMLTASTSTDTKPVEDTAQKQFSVHEVDQNVLTQIKELQTQVDQAIQLIEPSSTEAAQLESMKQRLVQFKREYKHTSPALALLGPIGYTGIVIKEQRIEKGILKITNALNTILYEHAKLKEEFVPVKAIAKGIEIAHTMLTQLNNPEELQGEKETVN